MIFSVVLGGAFYPGYDIFGQILPLIQKQPVVQETVPFGVPLETSKLRQSLPLKLPSTTGFLPKKHPHPNASLQRRRSGSRPKAPRALGFRWILGTTRRSARCDGPGGLNPWPRSSLRKKEGEKGCFTEGFTC